MSEIERQRVSAQEFFQLPETNVPTELIAGEVIVSPSPIPTHQAVSHRLGVLLEALIPGGDVFAAPMDVYFDDENVLQPDTIWVAPGSRCTIGPTRLEGAPDLLVEILSPGTARRDKVSKFTVYEKYGVHEFWIIDAERQMIEVWQLQGGTFVLLGNFGRDETFVSPVLGDKPVDVNAVFSRR